MHSIITEQFEELGIEPSDEILDKCVELCLTYKIDDAVEFVEQWMAYSISKLNGSEPTVQLLLEFERKVLMYKKKDNTCLKTKNLQTETEFVHNSNQVSAHLNTLIDYDDINPITLYGNANIDSDSDRNDKDQSFLNLAEVESDKNLTCKTPKALKSSVLRTPANRHHDVKFSPASYSPVCGTPRSPSKTFGKICYTYGHANFVNDTLSFPWTGKKGLKITIKNITTYENEPLSNKSKYLFDNLLEKVNLAADNVFERGKEICKKHFGPNTIDYDVHHPDVPNQEKFKTIGTIFCEHENQLDKNSINLVGSDDMKVRMVNLDVRHSKPFAIFPGQTVMVSGTNPSGDTIIVDEIINERVLQQIPPPKIDETIQFVFASGPFTHSDDLMYEPLSELIAYCKENSPNVLVLMGPFIDADHCMITGNVIAESFDVYFTKIIAGIVDELGSDIAISVIASNRDVIADMVYPTPPINLAKTYSNVHMLPDPCIINVNGIHIGLTSTNIFDHMLNNEFAIGNSDKVKRITNYLFHQGSFYPLSPPVEGMCYDSDLANKYSKIVEVPHMLVLPSNDKIFIRDINNCLTFNPGRVADEPNGTFARLAVHQNKDKENPVLFDYVACQILKL